MRKCLIFELSINKDVTQNHTANSYTQHKQAGQNITTNKLNSQKALIEWGRDIIKAHHPADFQRVAKIYDNDEYLCYPDVYEKLINLTMNLDINKG